MRKRSYEFKGKLGGCMEEFRGRKGKGKKHYNYNLKKKQQENKADAASRCCDICR